MIAASDPQEYVPSGRQQAFRHPGPLESTVKHSKTDVDEFLLNKFEKVSLTETKRSEFWTLRKVPNPKVPQKYSQDSSKNINKSYQHTNYKTRQSDFLDESISFKTNTDTSLNKLGKRLSDVHSPKFSSKRLSGEGDKSIYEPNKSQIQKQGQYTHFSIKSDPTYMEDELYVNGHTAIWSRGLVNNHDDLDNGRKTICSYTSESVIHQALWCTFYCECPVFEEHIIDLPNLDEPTGNPVEAVCITDLHNIKVFTPKGEDYTVPVPFVIDKIWSTKYGILISKENQSFPKDNIYENRATLFSLAYPLDDICPVVMNQSSNLNIINNNNMTVIYTNDDPSICMIYDSITKQHSVYRIRKVRPDEREFGDKIASISTSQSNKLKSRLSMWDNVNNKYIPSTPLSINGSNIAQTANSRSQSSMAMMSRCQSPAPSSYNSPWPPQTLKVHTSFKNSTVFNKSYFDLSKNASYLRATPTICLDYLWTDNYSVQDSNTAAPASKVFFVDDFVGQKYLCYILESRSQLSIVKVDFSSRNIVFGMLTSISAKDATHIPHLHMLAILEHGGNVTLYSGLNIIGKLHIGGTLAQHTPSPYVRRQTPQVNFSPYPKRSSLLPHIKSTDPQFDEHLLSPVLPNMVPRNPILHMNFAERKNDKKVTLNGLIHAIEDRITLKYSDDTFYRITLPSLASTSLVESCLIVLRQILQKDVAATLFCRWYSTKNVIGAKDITSEQKWAMFTNLIFELLGYDDEQLQESSGEVPVTPSNVIKKQKCSTGTDNDWMYICNSKHRKIKENINSTLKIECTENIVIDDSKNRENIDTRGVLFPYIRQIHFNLHLLYEDLKLNTLRSEELLPLMELLNKLAIDLSLDEYNLHYWLDFPNQTVLKKHSIIPQTELKNINCWQGYSEKPISIFKYIYDLLDGVPLNPYPYLDDICSRSRDILQLCSIISQANNDPNNKYRFGKELNGSNNEDFLQTPLIYNNNSYLEEAVLLMVEMKMTTSFLDTLPYSIYFILYDTLWKCRENPPADWPAEAYFLLWREDLAAEAIKSEKEKTGTTQELVGMYSNTQLEDVMPGIKADFEQVDGMEDIDNSLMKLRFSEDVRVNETRKMLQSSRPVPIVLTQRPDVSDHDFIEEQEKHLYGICIRTMALPVGRGMFTLRTATPVITEPLPAPPLCLTGKAPPRGTTVDLNHIDTPANMNLWPLFHNGVANGLRITPDAHNIDNTWIIFNKCKGSNDLQMEHAGFLLALGLNGHLRNLAFNSTFNYLEKLHEMTSVGVLLGLSAAFRGTAHPCLTKTLAIHVEALLPPTSMELDIPQTLQVAGLLGIGLVYQGTTHRHITEVLLTEIGRPPGPEMENSVDRESYSLAAGLALGLVTLKNGERPSGLSDLNVPDTLHYYMVGGNKRPLTGSQKDKYKTPSFQIREGTSVNLDVTAPGATLALGLMYLGTGNKAIADWMAPPQTQYLLDFVRPDFLLLRTLSRSLILWNEIEPSKDWVESQVPSTIRPYCLVKPCNTVNVDYEAMNQAYCNIVTGACFAMGLKFAGTAEEEAYETLLYFCHMFTSLTGKSIAELAGKSTIETCLNVLLLSVSMVMAGTGNIEIMRLVRHLRRRVGVSSSPVVTYGSHLAIHMALGLLFLGGGRYTLSNSASSVAALICAFYPKFPTHSNDNRYHLQAFRHLYVLAVEARLIIPKEVHLDEISYANLRVVKLDGTVLNVKGPGIIPDLNTLTKVEVNDERYWPVVFERGKNWNLLEKILSTTGYIEVKQRAGCLSYILDKFGYRSQLARTLTHSLVVPWDPSPSSITLFTSDKSVKLFCRYFLSSDNATESSLLEASLKQTLSKITYDAVVKDKLIVIVVYIALVKVILDLENNPCPMNIWQFKIIAKRVMKSHCSNLLSKEIILSLRQEYMKIFDKWEDNMKQVLQRYLQGVLDFSGSTDNLLSKKLSAYVIFFDFPWNCESITGEFLEIFEKLANSSLCTETVEKIVKVMN
ncbi:anaphase-promoting complex subunit 1 isoform X1 [Diorhabda sublineata]|uniref:anaphase-promoting complex subunit 1 isoform X1 n=1 Tax=Diorhabda sublineata TaxID=1163346 RepID=UPI0024E0E154|nr:anaphase-promoting complex subunit 1 isoform X1 [Diorhabda sublineata]